jgi:tetratricopeptide (TPR) repeat protein
MQNAAPSHFSSDQRTSYARKKLAATALVAVLAAVATGTVFFLPGGNDGTVPSQSPPAAPATGPTPVPEHPPADAKAQADRKKAEDVMSEALRRLARAESDGARTWGLESMDGVNLAEAEKALMTGQEYFDRGKDAEAIAKFTDTIALFDKLEQSRPERFRRAMSAGDQAFRARDAATAADNYARALSITPGDAKAKAGLARAKSLPEVLAKLAEGKALEESNQLEKARMSYARAASLDAEFVPAHDVLARVETAIDARDYHNALSDTLVAIEKGDLAAAAAALKRARAIVPSSADVAAAASRLATARQAAMLDSLRRSALTSERKEQWTAALGLYKKALSIDGNAAFAETGAARAETMSRLYAALDRYLNDPARLHSAEPLSHAKTLVEQARGQEDGKPELAGKVQNLDRLIALAQTPAAVTLQSDGQTRITVYRIGRFEPARTIKLDLRPGNYIAVGTRPGYRDVRVTFKVEPGMKTLAITVQSTEQVSP